MAPDVWSAVPLQLLGGPGHDSMTLPSAPPDPRAVGVRVRLADDRAGCEQVRAAGSPGPGQFSTAAAVHLQSVTKRGWRSGCAAPAGRPSRLSAATVRRHDAVKAARLRVGVAGSSSAATTGSTR